jgi:anti-sigma factor RsiW
MNHEEALILLPAYIDKELSLSETVDFERHLNSCDECQHEYNEQVHVSTLIKNNAKYFEGTPQFTKRLEASLPSDRTKATQQKSPNSFWNLIWVNTWGGRGAIMASFVALAWSASLLLMLPSAQDKLTEELVSSHVRSLEVDHLSDVISTDHHTVKPWFNGKLDYSPPVIDLATMGFPMEGGRLDYINGKTVAVVIYRHNKHPVNLYVWPSNNKDSDIQRTTRNGYNLAHWVIGNMNYWAITDLEAGKLLDFAQTLRTEVTNNQKS